MDLNTLDEYIRFTLEEDIGPGDITTAAIISEHRSASARISTKQPLLLAGMKVAHHVFEILDPTVSWNARRQDGERCPAGAVIALVTGNAQKILAGERTALNFLQRLSGIATITAQFVAAVAGTDVKILDTRKTTPGLRPFEKYAVLMGGGKNHRMGLYDHYLIKDNHIAVAGSITAAVKAAQSHYKPGQLIEVETETISDVKEALKANADVILLDNMTPQEVKKAVGIAKGKAQLEVSGNITLQNIREYAETGVDFISIGALTHSAPSADISMKIDVEDSIDQSRK